MNQKNKTKRLIVILGPTATGKTKLAARLAAKFGGEIISADSRQIYRGMDIGTGKDLKDYRIARGFRSKRTEARIPYHLIDIIGPQTEFNVAKYQQLAYQAITDVLRRGRLPFLVGGTGLYIDAVVKGYQFAGCQRNQKEQKQIRQQLNKITLARLLKLLKKVDLKSFRVIDQKNRRRVQRALEIYYETGRPKSAQPAAIPPNYKVLLLGIKLPLVKIYQKIDSRLEARIGEGLVAEVKKLRRQGVSWKRLDEFGLEYRFVSHYLRGLIGYEQMVTGLRQAIHQFAKRQLTWFKRDKDIIWIKNYAAAEKKIKKFIK